jgi:hypothetical protein
MPHLQAVGAPRNERRGGAVSEVRGAGSAAVRVSVPTNFVQTVFATWQAEQQAHEIATINAQMTTHRLAAQLFFRFAPLISLFMTAEFKRRLGVTSTADAALYANQGQHTRDRHPKEAYEILAALPRAEEHLVHIGRSAQHEGRFELVFNYKDGLFLYMPIKFVSAADSKSAHDECWIGTAFVLDDHKLRQKIRSKQLTPATES